MGKLDTVLQLVCAATLLAAPAAAQTPAGRWVDVEVPAGFHLDLATGEVTSRPAAGSPGTLSWVDGRLIAFPRLAAWPRPGAERVSTRVARGGGTPVDAPVPEAGDELLFDLGADLWGYLRVLAVAEASVRIEYARAAPGAAALERAPARLEGEAVGGSFRLQWGPVEDGATYVVGRSAVGRGEAVSEWRVAGGEWIDPEPDLGALLEYRVSRVGSPAVFGSRVRLVDVVQPGEWPQPLEKGSRIDLLTGALDGDGADVEVIYVSPPTVAFRPLDGTELVVLPARDPVPWELPAAQDGRYVDQVRTVSLDSLLGARLREGVYVRLSFATGPDGRVSLLRQSDLYGGRVLPAPPAPPAVRWTPDGPAFELEPPGPAVPGADALHVVVEREVGYQRGDWEEVLVGPPGERQLLVPLQPRARDAPPLTRFRFRHRFPWGADSFAGEPVRVLLGDSEDRAQVEAWLGTAFEDLLHPDFERRLAARGVLESLGDAALPRLEAALTSKDPELVTAAKDILLATATADGGHVELLLRARAIGDGVHAAAPPGLFDASPGRRAWALLRAHARAGPSADLEAWRRVLASADPDGGVARMADMLGRSPAGDFARPADGQPYALWPRSRERDEGRPDWRWLLVEESPAEVVRIVRESVDLAEPDGALLLLQAARVLEEAFGSGARWSAHPDVAESVELALRLLERSRAGGEPVLGSAAAALLRDPGARLEALRELFGRRLAHRAGSPPVRGRVELIEPSLDDLTAQLASLFSEGASYVDVVLPAGEYSFADGAEEPWVDLRLSGLRLLGGPGVVLRAGLRVVEAQDVVLEGLTVRNDRGPALHLTQSSAVAVDCSLVGAQTTILVDRSQVELSGVECGTDTADGATQWAVRLIGPSRLAASGSVFASGTLATGTDGALHLDRCVVDVAVRTAIQGQRGDSVVLRDCLVRSGAVGLMGIDEGLAVGVVFDTAREPLGRGPTGMRVCPELVAVTDQTPPIDRALLLERCPLERR